MFDDFGDAARILSRVGGFVAVGRIFVALGSAVNRAKRPRRLTAQKFDSFNADDILRTREKVVHTYDASTCGAHDE